MVIIFTWLTTNQVRGNASDFRYSQILQFDDTRFDELDFNGAQKCAKVLSICVEIHNANTDNTHWWMRWWSKVSKNFAVSFN